MRVLVLVSQSTWDLIMKEYTPWKLFCGQSMSWMWELAWLSMEQIFVLQSPNSCWRVNGAWCVPRRTLVSFFFYRESMVCNTAITKQWPRNLQALYFPNHNFHFLTQCKVCMCFQFFLMHFFLMADMPTRQLISCEYTLMYLPTTFCDTKSWFCPTDLQTSNIQTLSEMKSNSLQLCSWLW